MQSGIEKRDTKPIDINRGIDKSKIEGLYISVADYEPKVQASMQNLRRGYPNLPYEEQCHGEDFRKNADVIALAIAEKTIVDLLPHKENVVLLLPWRGGLAFGPIYNKLGIDKFAHISSKRNEETLETEVDYEKFPIIDENTIVVLADPMLATGNTMIDAIKRLKTIGIREENIVINAIIAAPIGVKKIVDKFSKVKIIVGIMDEKLDEKGYIVPGLGDFGDKYFEGLDEEYVKKLGEDSIIEEDAGEKLLLRINRQKI